MTGLCVSVLMSVYEGENPKSLNTSIRSVINQTRTPDEFVIVKDGPLTPELNRTLDQWKSNHPSIIAFLELDKNRGLGAALRAGVKSCSHRLVARMDADDIAVEDRFERQVQYLTDNPEVDVVGGYVSEFTGSPSSTDPVRSVPTNRHQVRPAARFRCPVNHPTAMFRRESVLNVGNYRPFRSMQDYDLWMRMLSQGYVIENISDVLVKCRAGNDLYRRRGGFSYAHLEAKLQFEFLQMGAITFPFFVFNLFCRVPIRLVPNWVRSLLYRRFLRD